MLDACKWCVSRNVFFFSVPVGQAASQGGSKLAWLHWICCLLPHPPQNNNNNNPLIACNLAICRVSFGNEFSLCDCDSWWWHYAEIWTGPTPTSLPHMIYRRLFLRMNDWLAVTWLFGFEHKHVSWRESQGFLLSYQHLPPHAYIHAYTHSYIHV